LLTLCELFGERGRVRERADLSERLCLSELREVSADDQLTLRAVLNERLQRAEARGGL